MIGSEEFVSNNLIHGVVGTTKQDLEDVVRTRQTSTTYGHRFDNLSNLW